MLCGIAVMVIAVGVSKANGKYIDRHVHLQLTERYSQKLYLIHKGFSAILLI